MVSNIDIKKENNIKRLITNFSTIYGLFIGFLIFSFIFFCENLSLNTIKKFIFVIFFIYIIALEYILLFIAKKDSIKTASKLIAISRMSIIVLIITTISFFAGLINQSITIVLNKLQLVYDNCISLIIQLFNNSNNFLISPITIILFTVIVIIVILTALKTKNIKKSRLNIQNIKYIKYSYKKILTIKNQNCGFLYKTLP